MIKQIDTLAAQQNLQFVLVLHPDWGRSASNETKHLLLAQAQLRNLTVLDFSSIPYGANRTLGCDPHPNGELNQEFTHALITALRSDGTLS